MVFIGLGVGLLISGILGLVGSLFGAAMTAAHNRANREDTQEFDAEQAEISRDFNAEEAVKTREFNAEEAQKNRDFQEYMASTAMQRQVADYKAAGINIGALGGSGVTSAFNGATASGGTASSSPIASSNALMNYGIGSDLSNTLSSVISNATKATLKQNAKELGDNVEDQMAINARREAILKEQAEREQFYKDHPGEIDKEIDELLAI